MKENKYSQLESCISDLQDLIRWQEITLRNRGNTWAVEMADKIQISKEEILKKYMGSVNWQTHMQEPVE